MFNSLSYVSIGELVDNSIVHFPVVTGSSQYLYKWDLLIKIITGARVCQSESQTLVGTDVLNISILGKYWISSINLHENNVG